MGHSIVDIGGMVSKRGTEDSEPGEGLVQRKRMREGLHGDVSDLVYLLQILIS